MLAKFKEAVWKRQEVGVDELVRGFGEFFRSNFHRRTFALDTCTCSLRDDGWGRTFVISIDYLGAYRKGRADRLAFSLSEWKKVKVCRWVKCMPKVSCVMSLSVLFFRQLNARSISFFYYCNCRFFFKYMNFILYNKTMHFFISFGKKSADSARLVGCQRQKKLLSSIFSRMAQVSRLYM